MQKGIWSLEQEVNLITDLIKRNYRWVPFSNLHLNARLRRILHFSRGERVPINLETLRQDERMWLLMRNFGETTINEDLRLRWAMKWWLSIIQSDFFDRPILTACMNYPLDIVVTTSKTSVLTGNVPKLEREERAAKLLAFLLWASYVKSERRITEVWLAIRDCVENLFPKRELMVFARMPNQLLDAANHSRSFTPDKKTNLLYDLISRIPSVDKERFELYLLKNANKIK